MTTNRDIQMRDPFVLARPETGKYYLFGTTDKDCWKGPGTGFDVYSGDDLENWEGPFPAWRPEAGFRATHNFWAPEAHEYRGRYYLFASFKSDSVRRGTQILVADDPAGPYRPHSDGPVTPPEWECLDGTLHVDENGDPWIVFCHEWVQVTDGEICARRLSADLGEAVGEPVLLFCASEAAWTRPPRSVTRIISPDARVTDGPFLWRTGAGVLLMLWSSYSDSGYAMGIARSETGTIAGPWIQETVPIANTDSGHGMLFRSFDGRLFMTVHSPNSTPDERPVFIEVGETGSGIRVRDRSSSSLGCCRPDGSVIGGRVMDSRGAGDRESDRPAAQKSPA
ncbi:MAG: glycoside hydrolase family 43 protein [Rectinemataceae bacterium]|nr:glycoside hydrolase family 43 protein [Rectinemataceae bacterium]